MKKIMMTLAAVLCCFISVNAQTTETESNSEKYLRLSKEADENPTDWKAQMEVVKILTDKTVGFTTSTAPHVIWSAYTIRPQTTTRRCPTLCCAGHLSRWLH